MRDFDQIRFITSNYSSLQGLKAVPIGLLLLFMCMWASAQQGPRHDLLLPILTSIGAVVLYLAIDRYYIRVFGRVERTKKNRLIESALEVLAGIFALGGFWIDVSRNLPISTYGLVFGAAILADYFRMTCPIRSRSFFIYPVLPITAVLVLIVSFLPLYGEDFLKTVGVVSPMLGVYMIIGFIITISGILSHIYLVRNLPPTWKIGNDQSV